MSKFSDAAKAYGAEAAEQFVRRGDGSYILQLTELRAQPEAPQVYPPKEPSWNPFRRNPVRRLTNAEFAVETAEAAWEAARRTAI